VPSRRRREDRGRGGVSDLGRSGGTSARREELGIAPGRSSHVRLRVRHHRTWRSWRPLRVPVRYFDCGLSGPYNWAARGKRLLNCRPQRRDRVLLSSQAWSFRGGARATAGFSSRDQHSGGGAPGIDHPWRWRGPRAVVSAPSSPSTDRARNIQRRTPCCASGDGSAASQDRAPRNLCDLILYLQGNRAIWRSVLYS
jgi:hypothetical protein